jgi:hypothetical protein
VVRWVIDIVAAALLIVALLVACDRVPDIGRVLGGPTATPTATATVQPAQRPQAPAAPVNPPSKAVTPVAPKPSDTAYPQYPAPAVVPTEQSYPYPNQPVTPFPQPTPGTYPYPSPAAPAKK